MAQLYYNVWRGYYKVWQAIQMWKLLQSEMQHVLSNLSILESFRETPVDERIIYLFKNILEKINYSFLVFFTEIFPSTDFFSLSDDTTI